MIVINFGTKMSIYTGRGMPELLEAELGFSVKIVHVSIPGGLVNQIIVGAVSPPLPPVRCSTREIN